VPETGAGPPTAAEVLAYLRQALLFGYFPGFNGSYWSSSTSYERDRALFKQYMPLIKKVVAAGWKPVPYATPSDAAIYVERFDDQVGSTFYLTAQNSSTPTKTFQMTVDGASLDAGSGTITLKELVGNTTISASRSGSNVLFSDTLATGETALYEITVGTGGTPPPATLPANPGFESGSGSPTGWTLGTSVTNGSWSWDASSAHSDTRSAKLVVPGVVSLTSPWVRSDAFALGGGRTTTFSAWVMTSNAGGTYKPTVWLVELDASGNVLMNSSGSNVQHSLQGDSGTSGWVQKFSTFTTDPRCVRAFVYANIYKGYGTFSVDDIQVK
jgi:hypothetical protein